MVKQRTPMIDETTATVFINHEFQGRHDILSHYLSGSTGTAGMHLMCRLVGKSELGCAEQDESRSTPVPRIFNL